MVSIHKDRAMAEQYMELGLWSHGPCDFCSPADVFWLKRISICGLLYPNENLQGMLVLLIKFQYTGDLSCDSGYNTIIIIIKQLNTAKQKIKIALTDQKKLAIKGLGA